MAASYFKFTQLHANNQFSHETNSKFENIRSKLTNVLYEIDVSDGLQFSWKQKSIRQKLNKFNTDFERFESYVQKNVETNAGGYVKNDLASTLSKIVNIKHLINEGLYGIQSQDITLENLVKIKTELEFLKQINYDAEMNTSIDNLSSQIIVMLKENGWAGKNVEDNTCMQSMINVIVPGDCSAFYHCTGTQGNKVRKQCAPGTLFNPVTMICDWPLNVYKARPECNPAYGGNDKVTKAVMFSSPKPEKFIKQNYSKTAGVTEQFSDLLSTNQEVTTLSPGIAGGLLFTIPQSFMSDSTSTSELTDQELALELLSNKEKDNLIMLTKPTEANIVTESSNGIDIGDDIIIVDSAKSSPPLACEEDR